MPNKVGPPTKDPKDRVVDKSLAFPPVKLLRMQAMAIEDGFVTATGKPKLAKWLMYKAGL